MTQKISPCLWFEDQAEQAADFYVALFKNSRVIERTVGEEGESLPSGAVLTVRFVLDGVEFTALNGGRRFSFTPAISFQVYCDTQAELDELWGKLAQGGQEGPYGWINDRFGVSWRVWPKTLPDMLRRGDSASHRVLEALLGMDKPDISTMVQAYETPGFRLRPEVAEP
jgi:predicted 3-demethylubiquinone-9 3-methyltransferase (glyoxalase superfamily)